MPHFMKGVKPPAPLPARRELKKAHRL